MGHELQPVQMPGPTYYKNQLSHPDQKYISWHCSRINPPPNIWVLQSQVTFLEHPH